MEIRLDRTDVEALRRRLQECATAVSTSEAAQHLRLAGAELLKAFSSVLQSGIERLEPPAGAADEADGKSQTE